VADRLVAQLYSATGEPAGEVALDPEVFGIEPNATVMHQVVTAQRAAARSGSASTKTRAEVRGGGRKPWRQKGLGRARHGSIRSPQWRGGGVTFGPRPRDYSQRTPRKMKRLALRSALSARAAEDQIKVLEGFDWDVPKTRAAVDLLATIGIEGKALVVIGAGDATAERAFRNIPTVNTIGAGQLNTYDVLWADTVLFTSAALEGAAGAAGYEVTDSDFVPDDDADFVAEDEGGETS
jgi:large subunit ribosomal protein L4